MLFVKTALYKATNKDMREWQDERRPVRDALVGGLTGAALMAPAAFATTYPDWIDKKNKKLMAALIMAPGIAVGAHAGYRGHTNASHPIDSLTDKEYRKRRLAAFSERNRREIQAERRGR